MHSNVLLVIERIRFAHIRMAFEYARIEYALREAKFLRKIYILGGRYALREAS
jgi:hypothetical protein